MKIWGRGYFAPSIPLPPKLKCNEGFHFIEYQLVNKEWERVKNGHNPFNAVYEYHPAIIFAVICFNSFFSFLMQHCDHLMTDDIAWETEKVAWQSVCKKMLKNAKRKKNTTQFCLFFAMHFRSMPRNKLSRLTRLNTSSLKGLAISNITIMKQLFKVLLSTAHHCSATFDTTIVAEIPLQRKSGPQIWCCSPLNNETKIN